MSSEDTALALMIEAAQLINAAIEVLSESTLHETRDVDELLERMKSTLDAT